ncbi:arginine deiminase-related protein [Patescibacteria group bacterium]|nr:arginine deiminase-related protein [Patescibacteria group bacterium]MCL5798426.1 arginine deiminase-related protein [Patescibacteria group bacterium]
MSKDIKTVLLCPPDYYQIEYEINPWMDIKNKVDQQKVKSEYKNLKDIYRKLDLEVQEIDAQPGLPDMVYAANHGFVIDDIFIKSNFRFQQRRKEADWAEKYFKEKGFKIKKIPEGIYFEGQGDMFYRDGKFFCGWGKRTSKEALKYIEKIVGEKVISFEVNDPYYYHLDTCFAPLGDGKVVINPSSFSNEDVEKIKKNFKKVILAQKADMPFMCCNILSRDHTVITGRGVGKDVKSELLKVGYEIFETQMEEYFKGGGSVKCLTLEYFRS